MSKLARLADGNIPRKTLGGYCNARELSVLPRAVRLHLATANPPQEAKMRDDKTGKRRLMVGKAELLGRVLNDLGQGDMACPQGLCQTLV